MPRTCLACKSHERKEIDKAIVAGEPLRKIAENFPISMTALHRHKPHVSQAIVKAEEKREERAGENLLDEMRRVQRKVWEILAKMEAEGDHRGSIVALREVRECMESLDAMLAKAQGSGPAEVRVLIEHVGAAPQLADGASEQPLG
jgi:hypothetical protein